MKIREAFITYKESKQRTDVRELCSPQDIARYMAGAFSDYPDQEQFWVILLNAKLRPIARSRLFIGTLDGVTVHPREVLRIAVCAAAHSFAIVHNHPSGDVEPSPQDRTVTDAIKDAADLLGIPLVDHVIIGDDGAYSSWERGW
jgi:DNA repair protein RadC